MVGVADHGGVGGATAEWISASAAATRSGLKGLIANTLNVKLATPYTVVPDFILTRQEYHGWEELRFKHCRLAGMADPLDVRPLQNHRRS
jgi:hypothetical protein